MISSIRVGNTRIGRDCPCFIVAEAGVNHCGNIDLAFELIESASQSGADAIKFQCYVTEDLVTIDAPKARYQESDMGSTTKQYEMLKALELDAKDLAKLRDHCLKKGIMFICTPYDQRSVDTMEDIEQPMIYKIASTDTTNTPFLKYIASKNRPVILSTGMCSLGEVELAVNTLKESGLENRIIILQCTSEYPVPMQDVNLRAMETMERAFCCPVGFSDHTFGIEASSWAVAMGACMIEKHLTLDRTLSGPDHKASIEPTEFASLVNSIRQIEVALGDGIKRVMPSETDNKERMQRSLVAKRNIQIGKSITRDDLTCKRPGSGLPPLWFDLVIGKVAINHISDGSIISLNDIDWI